jgi:hypothetical protein
MDGGTMPQKKHTIATEDRRKSGQSVPLGDTGEGDTGVPDNEQGISKRPGDKDDAPLDHMERPTSALHLTRVTLSLRQLGAEPHTKEVGRDEVYNHHCLRSARRHDGSRGLIPWVPHAGASYAEFR